MFRKNQKGAVDSYAKAARIEVEIVHCSFSGSCYLLTATVPVCANKEHDIGRIAASEWRYRWRCQKQLPLLYSLLRVISMRRLNIHFHKSTF